MNNVKINITIFSCFDDVYSEHNKVKEVVSNKMLLSTTKNTNPVYGLHEKSKESQLIKNRKGSCDTNELGNPTYPP